MKIQLVVSLIRSLFLYKHKRWRQPRADVEVMAWNIVIQMLLSPPLILRQLDKDECVGVSQSERWVVVALLGIQFNDSRVKPSDLRFPRGEILVGWKVVFHRWMSEDMGR